VKISWGIGGGWGAREEADTANRDQKVRSVQQNELAQLSAHTLKIEGFPKNKKTITSLSILIKTEGPY